jgi:hypothetical protein
MVVYLATRIKMGGVASSEIVRPSYRVCGDADALAIRLQRGNKDFLWDVDSCRVVLFSCESQIEVIQVVRGKHERVYRESN